MHKPTCMCRFIYIYVFRYRRIDVVMDKDIDTDGSTDCTQARRFQPDLQEGISGGSGCRLTGFVVIEKAGDYRFYIGSDDGLPAYVEACRVSVVLQIGIVLKWLEHGSLYFRSDCDMGPYVYSHRAGSSNLGQLPSLVP